MKNEKIAILLVDHNDEDILNYKQLLQKPELDILTTTSGTEALTLMLDYNFSLVLLDVKIQDMDAFEFVQLMKSDEELKNIPIVFVTTADKDNKPITNVFDTDTADYLCKPIDPEILNKKVNTIISLEMSRKKLEKMFKRLKREITRRKMMEEKIRNNKKLEGIMDIAGTICHELNQPLQIISGLSELLLLDIPKDNHLFKKLTKIQKQVARVTKLTNKLKRITKYGIKQYSSIKMNIMDQGKTIERRKYKRFIPSINAVVLPESDPFKQSRMIDISMGGLAFWYNESKRLSKKTAELDIRLKDGHFHLDKIPYKVISGKSFAEISSNVNEDMKRIGVQFGELIPEQIDRLEYFIQNHTSAKIV